MSINLYRVKSIRLVLTLTLFWTPLLADKPWKEKKFTEWTAEEAQKVLSDSPWVKKMSIGLFLGIDDGPNYDTGGSGRPRNPNRQSSQDQQVRRQVFWAKITWVAQPIRQAYARLAQLSGNATAQEPEELESIQFFIRGEVLPRLTYPEDTRIRSGSFLKIKNRQDLPPQQVLFNQEFEADPLIVLIFPKSLQGKPTVTLDDKDVELILLLGEKTVKQKFKLKDFLVDEQLEI